ncbi:MAG: SocA family protein [Endomicrobium sp.]|nr:SocA family protein [Endomicrobium sp.]
MNLEKIIQIVNYILQKYNFTLNYTKLLKILYIADRECLRRWDFAISEDTYCAMKQGMVLSGLYSFITQEADESSQARWNSCFKKDGDNDLCSIVKENCSYDELSKAEIEILDEVDKKYHSKDWKFLVDEIHHNFREWKEVDEKKEKSSVKVKKETILLSLGRSEDEIKEIISNENAYRKCKDDLQG